MFFFNNSKLSLNSYVEPSKTSLQQVKHLTSLLNAVSNTRWFLFLQNQFRLVVFVFPQKSFFVSWGKCNVCVTNGSKFADKVFSCSAKSTSWNFSRNFFVWVTVSEGVEFSMSKKKKIPARISKLMPQSARGQHEMQVVFRESHEAMG